MKIYDQRQQLKAMSLADLRAAVIEIENKIQKQAMSIQFGKTKDVSTLSNLKKQLARTLTVANQKLRETEKE